MGVVATSGLVSHISRCGEEILPPCPQRATEMTVTAVVSRSTTVALTPTTIAANS